MWPNLCSCRRRCRKPSLRWTRRELRPRRLPVSMTNTLSTYCKLLTHVNTQTECQGPKPSLYYPAGTFGETQVHAYKTNFHYLELSLFCGSKTIIHQTLQLINIRQEKHPQPYIFVLSQRNLYPRLYLNTANRVLHLNLHCLHWHLVDRTIRTNEKITL